MHRLIFEPIPLCTSLNVRIQSKSKLCRSVRTKSGILPQFRMFVCGQAQNLSDSLSWKSVVKSVMQIRLKGSGCEADTWRSYASKRGAEHVLYSSMS